MVGGGGRDAEGAGRAGVRLAAIRTWSFELCSATAGLGGILLGSFFFGQYSTNTADAGQLVLYSVAASVIGGVTLHPARGEGNHPGRGFLSRRRLLSDELRPHPCAPTDPHPFHPSHRP